MHQIYAHASSFFTFPRGHLSFCGFSQCQNFSGMYLNLAATLILFFPSTLHIQTPFGMITGSHLTHSESSACIRPHEGSSVEQEI